MRYIYLPALLLAACSAAELPKNVPPGERDPVTVEARFAGSEAGAQELAEFRFPKGSSRLGREARERIDNALKKAREEGKIAEVKIIAWSDNDSAPLEGDSLPKKDQDLAARRLEAVGRVLAPKVKEAKLRSYNMAASTGELDQLFGSSEYRLKESLRASGVATEVSEGTSMAGKALVMLVTEKPEPKER
jgi:hypothetical protein